LLFIKNDFAAPPGARTRGTAVKCSSVFQREGRARCSLLRQCILQNISS
jgi:hypothetical protein